MMSDSVTDLSALYKSLEKCCKEDVDPQPLYINSIDESGVLIGLGHSEWNMSTSIDECHLKARSRENEVTQTELGVQDIRSTNCNPA